MRVKIHARPMGALVGVGILACGSALVVCETLAQGVTNPDTTPPGMVAFFPSTTAEGCPTGWTELTAARGRFLMGVADVDTYAVGQPLGTALANLGLPGDHTHTYQSSFTLSKSGCGDGCGGGDLYHPAKEGVANPVPTSPPGTTQAGNISLTYTQLLACQKDDANAGEPSDLYPQYAVAFFNAGTCPDSGWEPMKGQLANGQEAAVNGYFLIPFQNASTGIGTLHLDPIGADGVLSHDHDFSSSVDFGEAHVETDSGSHGSLGQHGTYSFGGTTGPHSYVVPSVPLLLCQKTTFTSNTLPAGLPQKILLFLNEATCPNGWATAPTAEGRLMLGLPENGDMGQTAGGQALTQPGDVPSHVHTFSGSANVANWGVNRAEGGKHPVAPSDARDYSGTTKSPSAWLPYLALNLCQPDT